MSDASTTGSKQHKAGRAGLLWGTILLVLSVVAGIGGIVGIAATGVNSVSNLLDSPRMSVPGTSSLTLETGTWIIYEATGTSRGSGPIVGGVTTIRPSDVTVTGPDGATVPTGIPGGTQTVTVNSTVYTGAVSFPVNTTGTYRITIDDVDSGTVLVGRSVFDEFKSIGIWIVVFLSSGLLFLIGLIVLIVGIVRRSKANRTNRMSGPPPMPGGGYGAPGYGTPGYQVPGYQTPGYGAPGYGAPPQPGWGPPTGPAPQAPPPQPPTWPPPQGS